MFIVMSSLFIDELRTTNYEQSVHVFTIPPFFVKAVFAVFYNLPVIADSDIRMRR